MAVSFNVEHSRTSEYRLLPQHVTIIPSLNGRHEIPDVEDLITDILANGQIVPVTIRNDGGKPVLVAGFSRWRAISEINKRKLTALPLQLRCTYVQCSESEAFVANISENRFRRDVTPVDDAHNIKRLLNKYAMTEEQVVGVYFPQLKGSDDKAALRDALKWVKARIALIDLTPEAEKAVRSGQVAPNAAAIIAKMSAEHQREVVSSGKRVSKKDAVAASGSKPKPKKSASKAPEEGASLAHIKAKLETVIDTGEFTSPLTGKSVKASDDLVKFLAHVLKGE